MLNLESLSRNIAGNLKKQLELDDEKTSVIEYGLYAFFQMSLSIILVAIVGLIFNVIIEALIITFVISIFRKYSGGAHSATSINCLIIGVFVSVLPAVIIKKIPININVIILIGILIFIYSIFITYKLAPVDSINKPIRKKEKIKRLKKGSIIILIIYIVLIILNFSIYYYSNNEIFLIYCECIYIGVIWQVFTLTKVGHIVMKIIDSFLIKLIK